MLNMFKSKSGGQRICNKRDTNEHYLIELLLQSERNGDEIPHYMLPWLLDSP